ncbi:MAG TPA: DHA2 family efflux MFS transporter permease subunit [Croceibacterium sp.]|jgi:DHA2 family multidrug resistance protein
MATAAPQAGRRESRRSAPAELEDVAQLHVPNRWLFMIGVMAASLLQVLDTTIANVAIPHMQASLSATPDTISWVLTSYIVASAVAMPITGWLADRIGMRRLFLWAVTGFIISSALCGIAQNLSEMVLFRALQGVSGAFIAPLSQTAMLDTTRPSRQPQIIAVWGLGIMIGPILGPLIGGWLTENWNWRWCFYVNLPVGIAALTILLAQMPTRETRKRRFDLFGFAMLALALSSMQLFLDRGNQADWFNSVEIWIELAVALSAAWIAAIHLATSKTPLFHRALFADMNFIIALLFMIVIGVVMFGTMALLPLMLQQLLGYDVIGTGMILMPRGVGILISMQLSSYLMRKGFDARWIVAIGFLIGAWSMDWMAHWSLAVDQYGITMSGMVQGLGIGLVFIPLNATAFATLPPTLRTDGSSLLNLTRNIGSSVGISVAMTLLARNTQKVHSTLAEHITPWASSLFDVTSISQFAGYGDAATAMVNAEVTRQAAMVAYIDDFYLMMWLSLLSVPLVFFMRKNTIHSRR